MNNLYDNMAQFVIKSLKEQYGLDVRLNEMYGADFFPLNEEPAEGTKFYTIQFNRKVEELFELYNLALLDEQDTSKAIPHYVLFHAFLDIFDFEGAKRHLTFFKENLLVYNHKYTEENEIRTTTQILFTLLHEGYHILFHHDPKLKAQTLDSEKERMKDLRELLSNQLSSLFYDELMSHPKTQTRLKSLIPSAIPEEIGKDMVMNMSIAMTANSLIPNDFIPLISGEDEIFLEELSCDRMAWLYILEVLKGAQSAEEDIMQIHLWLYVALNAMQYDWFLQTQYRKIKHNRVYHPKAVVIRQKSYKTLIRHYLNIIKEDRIHKEYMHIADQLEKIYRETVMTMFRFQEDLCKLYTKNDRKCIDKKMRIALQDEMNKTIQSLILNKTI